MPRHIGPVKWILKRARQTFKASRACIWGSVPVSSGKQECWAGKQATNPLLWTRKPWKWLGRKVSWEELNPIYTKAAVLIADPIFLWVKTCGPVGYLYLHWLRIRQTRVLKIKTPLWLWVGKAGNDGFCDKLRLVQRCIKQPLLLNLNLFPVLRRGLYGQNYA